MPAEKPAPRLHALLARESPMAVLIRRGPSKQTAVIGWDRSTDTFTLGQWLKGNMYHYRCDISPDGKHWIYFACKGAGAYAVMAKTPYLKAVDFYAKGDSYEGGGLFISNKKYWLNDSYFDRAKFQQRSAFEVAGKSASPDAGCPGVYFPKLARDGWHYVESTRNREGGTACVFTKQTCGGWHLIKHFITSCCPPHGKGIHTEGHLLRNADSGAELAFPDWEWADYDGSRLLWAARGRVQTAPLSPDGLGDVRELFDAAPMAFAALEAPY
jgi:hypothetical protein